MKILYDLFVPYTRFNLIFSIFYGLQSLKYLCSFVWYKMENNIIKKLRDNIPISNNKSNFWVDRLKPIVSEDIYQVSGYGPYTPRHIIVILVYR